MKNIKYLSIAVLAGLAVSSCVDMNTYPEGYYVTSEQKQEIIKKDPSKAEAGVNGIFARSTSYAMAITEATRHNDIGYPALMMFMDTDGIDAVSQNNGYNWKGGCLDYTSRNYTSFYSRITWNTLYAMIYTSNSLISSIPDPSSPELKAYKAQGLATRAFNYWVLAQLYQFNYVDHKSSPCVPIVTDENSNDVAEKGVGRSSVEEVYALIMKDINEAITLLEAADFKRADKRYVDLGVAYGIRARVNLTMENWAAAAEDAQKAITASKAVPYSKDAVSKPTFYNSADNAWMWAIVITETDRVVTTGICNWPSHMGSLNYGYCNFSKCTQINKALYNSIPATDVRKGWWLNENKTSPNLTSDQQKYMDGKKYSAYTHCKFAPYKDVVGTSTNANDIPMMRVEEMYLIKAEGEAMSGNTTAAVSTLESLIKTYRDPEYSCTATSKTDIQNEIWRQRRIELWGEGLSWFDIMRLKKPVDRRGGGYPDVACIFNIPYGSDIMLWRIPQKEIEANVGLNESDNNPSAALPTPVTDID